MVIEKVIDFERIEYFIKLDGTMDNDLIPLPDGVSLVSDKWYRIVINKDDSLFRE